MKDIKLSLTCGSRELKSLSKIEGIKKILLMSAVGICFTANIAFASDNVLQAIQVDGVKDSYNIILKSDDTAEVKKIVQAPNKMIVSLKGIRASKTINTIYNNTSSVDSVVVEPTGDDSVRILVQADNAANAEVKFDTLKTPLGVLDKTNAQDKPKDELVLNAPMKSYKPVYDENSQDEEEGFSFARASHSAIGYAKKMLHSDKISFTIIFGLFAIIILGGIKTIKGKDNDIKVGLSQSLRDREIDLYRQGEMNNGAVADLSRTAVNQSLSQPAANMGLQNVAGGNYGLRAYQNGVKSPYLSAEVKRPRPASAPSINSQAVAKSVNSRPVSRVVQSAKQPSAAQTMMQNTIQPSNVKTAPVAQKAKGANIDSIKFLESMTKIYEKNGRSDLAQGLKTNMKKAKASLV